MHEIYGKTERRLFLALGLLIVVCASYVTYQYYHYRVVNEMWTETFTTPKDFWSAVPAWEWKSVVEDKNG